MHFEIKKKKAHMPFAVSRAGTMRACCNGVVKGSLHNLSAISKSVVTA